MPQILGIFLILDSLVFAGWWMVSGRVGSGFIVTICGLGVFTGIFLVMQDRATEITLKGIGTIKAAVQQATVDARQISDLKTRIEAQSATVDLIAKEAADAKRLSEEVDSKNIEADKKLKTMDDALQKANASLLEVQAYTQFNSTVLAAQNDDRRAFDQLLQWAEDSTYKFSTAAGRAFSAILDQHNPAMFSSGFKVPWGNGVDPDKLSFSELSKSFATIPPYVRLALLEYIWQRNDFTKHERMQFLVEVLKTDPSLQVVEYAGRYFSQESKDQLKPLAIRQHLEWWEKHGESFK